jgi:hypothetical protein
MAADLEVSIGVDVEGLNNGLNSASKRFEEFGKKMSNIGSTLSLAITVPLTLIAKQMIKLSSSTEESLNKVNVAFGKSADQVKSFAETSLTNFGIARGSALDMAAGFGDMATSMGLTQDQAAKMSVSLVSLGGDLASFKDIGIEQAKTALTGVFTGETESLKLLGIVMTEANLQAYALTKGFNGNFESLTQGEKVLLRYNYILDNTKNAQGDFERTGKGAANQMRSFGENLKEIGTVFGDILLPYFTKAINYINGLLKAFKGLDENTKKAILAMAGIVGVVAPIMIVIGKVIELSKYLTYLVTPVGLFAIAMGAAAIYVVKEWDSVRKFLIDLETRFFRLKQNIGQGLFNAGLISADTAFGDIPEGLKNIARYSQDAKGGINDFMQSLKSGMSSLSKFDMSGFGKGSEGAGVGKAVKAIKDQGYKRLEAFKQMHKEEVDLRWKQYFERIKTEKDIAIAFENDLKTIPPPAPEALSTSPENIARYIGLDNVDVPVNVNFKITEDTRSNFTKFTEEFKVLGEIAKQSIMIVGDGISNLFSDIFESLGSKEVKFDFKKVLGSFLRAMGQMVSTIGSAILAAGIGLTGSVFGMAEGAKSIATGLGLLALGGALMGGGASFSKGSSSGSSSVSTSTGARNIVPYSNPQSFNGGNVKFEIQGNTLVGVLNNVNRANG